jgi:4-hydroxy-tetrahydrodipicolinate synthase
VVTGRGAGIGGIIPALVTPFSEEEELDLEALERIVEYVIAAGVHGIFVLGSQGEFYAVSPEEHAEIVGAAVAGASGRVPIFAGASAVTTQDAVRLARASEARGADAVILLPPFFVRVSEQELRHHFETVAGSIDLPVVIYNQPERTAVSLSTTLVRVLARVPNIVGIKDSSGRLDQTLAYLDEASGDFVVLMGNDGLIASALIAGVSGAIAATANVVPQLTVEIWDAVQAGELERANDLQRRLARLRRAFGLGTFPVVGKEALAMIGQPAGPGRRPVLPLDLAAREELREVLAELGALPAVAEGR